MRIYTLFLIAGLLIGCSQPEARKPVVRKTSSFMSESIERNKILTKAENQLLQKKIEGDSLHQYLNSEQGFWYYYERRDTLNGPMPETGDLIVFNYDVRDLAEQVIFSEQELGPQSYTVDKEELISGLQDGLKLMREGERITFLFPSYKAYGYTGSERINPNQPLIYKVELIKVNKLTDNEKN